MYNMEKKATYHAERIAFDNLCRRVKLHYYYEVLPDPEYWDVKLNYSPALVSTIKAYLLKEREDDEAPRCSEELHQLVTV